MNDIEHKLIEIPIQFEAQIYTNIFKKKNNSTLKETIESPRYKSLYNTVLQNYPQELDTPLGDFLMKGGFDSYSSIYGTT